MTLLFKGYSPDLGAFWGTVSALVLSWLRKETAMGPRDIFHGLVAGAHNNTSAGAAIADPMRTGFAALKYGATLILIPYSFVYVPELLLQGTWLEISAATVSYAFGYAALAVAIQCTGFFPVKVSLVRRSLFLAAAVCFLFPMIVWFKIVGAVLLALAWGAVPFSSFAKTS